MRRYSSVYAPSLPGNWQLLGRAKKIIAFTLFLFVQFAAVDLPAQSTGSAAGFDVSLVGASYHSGDEKTVFTWKIYQNTSQTGLGHIVIQSYCIYAAINKVEISQDSTSWSEATATSADGSTVSCQTGMGSIVKIFVTPSGRTNYYRMTLNGHYTVAPGALIVKYGGPNGCEQLALEVQVKVVRTATVKVCKKEDAVLEADSSGTDFQWFHNGQPITGETAGSFTLKHMDLAKEGEYKVIYTKNNCKVAELIQVVMNELPVVTVNDAEICTGASVALTANGAQTYQWSDSETGQAITVAPLANTAYVVTGIDSNGCRNTDTATVTLKMVPSAPTVTVTDNCDGTSVLSTDATGTLLWSTGAATSSITVSTAGSYSVNQTVNGCTSSDGSGTAAPKTTPSAPTVTVTDNCDGTSVLSTDATGTLLWNTGAASSSITVNIAGSYSVNQTVNGCTSSDGSGTAAPKTTPSAPTVTVTDNCDGTSVLSTDATGTLLWSTGAATSSITVSTAGSYSVNQTVNGCTSSDGTGTAAPKTTPSAPTVTVTDNCDGSSVLSTDATGTLLWSTGAATSSITVSTAGSYSVNQTVNGCTSSDGTGTAAPKSTPVITVSPDVTICNGSSASLTASGASGYSWSPSQGLNTTVTATVVASPSATTNYIVTGTAANGCSANASVKVTVNLCANAGIYGGETSGSSFYAGTAVKLPNICITTGNGKTASVNTITNATPGVFLYYTNIVAPSTDFSVYIQQTQPAGMARFALQKSQLSAYVNGSVKIASGAEVAAVTGDGVIAITGVKPGAIVTISAKYDTRSIINSTFRGMASYGFVSRIATGKNNVATSSSNLCANTGTSILAAKCAGGVAVATNEVIAVIPAASPLAETLSAEKPDTEVASVVAYPNPFVNRISFTLNAKTEGVASLEIYNISGQRLATVFNGRLQAGLAHKVTYDVPVAFERQNLVYVFRQAGRKVQGILLGNK